MSDLLRLIGEWIQFLWPLRKVHQWERACYYRMGRYKRTLKPGIYPVLPWFHDVKAESVVKAIVGTPRLDLTLSDGAILTCKASAVVQVTDINLAVNNVDAYMESAQELLEAVVADKLAEVDAIRLSYEKRGRLLSDLKKWVNQEAAEFGIEFTRLRFTTFVLNSPTYRLLGDQPPTSVW